MAVPQARETLAAANITRSIAEQEVSGLLFITSHGASVLQRLLQRATVHGHIAKLPGSYYDARVKMAASYVCVERTASTTYAGARNS